MLPSKEFLIFNYHILKDGVKFYIIDNVYVYAIYMIRNIHFNYNVCFILSKILFSIGKVLKKYLKQSLHIKIVKNIKF